jgi:hypothetical protein
LLTLKKTYLIAICVLVLCSAILLVNVGTVKAFAAGYEFNEIWNSAGTTNDGKWTTATEWSIGEPRYIGTTQKAIWIMLCNTGSAYEPEYLVEFADNTPDAGDIIQVCMNSGAAASSPGATEFKFEIQGLTTKKAYTGSGGAWVESASALAAVKMAATRTTSAHDPAQHVVAEFSIDKATLAGWGAPPLGVRIACYDASTGNWVSWPPASTANDPSTWGLLAGYSADPFPEGLTIGVMLLVSSVAAVVSIRYFRKPPKV